MIIFSMLKVLNISFQKSLVSAILKIDIMIYEKSYNFFFEIGNELLLDQVSHIDFLLPILYVIAWFHSMDINLWWYYVTSQLIDNIKGVWQLYRQRWLFNHIPRLLNFSCLSEDSSVKKKKGKGGVFFSWGIDSLYTFKENYVNITHLIAIFGFDIHHRDLSLINMTKKKLKFFAQNHQKKLIFVKTNVRLLTEQYVNWNYIFWAAMASIGLLLDSKLDFLYISSWLDSLSDRKKGWWSHPDLDKLWSNGRIRFIHFGEGVSRMEKIKVIDALPGTYDVLRVCWENKKGLYNCGICEKCTRTILEYKMAKLDDKLYIIPQENYKIDNIMIKQANYSYYKNILDFCEKKSEEYCILTKKLKEYDLGLSSVVWQKRKNILFIDFNGVISYLPFWHSLMTESPVLFEKIQNILFRQNINLVQEWMKGEKQSEQICRYLAKIFPCDYSFLLWKLIENCKKMDIAPQVIHLLRALKDYYYIVLVTDNMDCFRRRTVSYRQQDFQVFDYIFDSSERWFFKKEEDGRAFLEQINMFEVKIEDCLLIDDSRNNTSFFQKIGGQSFCPKNLQEVEKVLKHILKNAKSKRIWQF